MRETNMSSFSPGRRRSSRHHVLSLRCQERLLWHRCPGVNRQQGQWQHLLQHLSTNVVPMGRPWHRVHDVWLQHVRHVPGRQGQCHDLASCRHLSHTALTRHKQQCRQTHSAGRQWRLWKHHDCQRHVLQLRVVGHQRQTVCHEHKRAMDRCLARRQLSGHNEQECRSHCSR